MSEEIDPRIEQLATLLRSAEQAVAFTGMGISAASIPTGFFEKMKAKAWTPIQFSEFVESEEHRREAWRRQLFATAEWANAQPNEAHLALAKLVALGKVSHVITQNVDNFHQQSGVPDAQIIELHGNSTYAACLDCDQRYELAGIMQAFQQNETLPVCDCGGIIKTAVVSFGQSMPEEPMRLAKQAALDCKLLLVLGSSLVVQPSSAIPKIAKENGATLVIVNHERTNVDSLADLVIHAGVGEALPAALAQL